MAGNGVALGSSWYARGLQVITLCSGGVVRKPLQDDELTRHDLPQGMGRPRVPRFCHDCHAVIVRRRQSRRMLLCIDCASRHVETWNRAQSIAAAYYKEQRQAARAQGLGTEQA